MLSLSLVAVAVAIAVGVCVAGRLASSTNNTVLRFARGRTVRVASEILPDRQSWW
jgi:hypothetical protein